MEKSTRTKEPSNLEPTQKQIEARKRLGEMAKLRAKARKEAKNNATESPTSDLKQEDEYSIVIKINDQEYTCKTNNLAEAFESLGLNIQRIKTRMKIDISQGDKKYNGLFNILQAKKLLKYPNFRNIAIRRIILK